MDLSKIIDQTLEVISNGGVILYPTDTIWGIGGDATNPEVIQKIYNIKKRPDSKSLVSLVSNFKMLKSLTPVSETVQNILNNSLKPTTVIYDNVVGIHSDALAEDGSAAIRISKDEYCETLIAKFGKPIISTSANISGNPSPSGFHSVSDEIKNLVDFIVPFRQEEVSENSASTILKVVGHEVIVIRE